MAKQDKATYDSYAPDMFDNPPAGPVGVHRGQRSAGARIAPYFIVLVIAVLAGALTWSLVTGEFSKITGLGGTTNTAQTNTTNGSGSSTTNDSSSGSNDTNSSDSTDSSKGSSSTDNTNGSSSDNTDSSNNDSNSSDTDTDSSTTDNKSDQSTDQSAQVNKSTSVRVVNAAGISGYAAQKKTALESAGYTAVEASNPTSTNLPASTVVWYQNDADKATAEDVASTLGITAVQQVSGLDVPVVVVLLN